MRILKKIKKNKKARTHELRVEVERVRCAWGVREGSVKCAWGVAREDRYYSPGARTTLLFWPLQLFSHTWWPGGRWIIIIIIISSSSSIITIIILMSSSIIAIIIHRPPGHQVCENNCKGQKSSVTGAPGL